MMIMMMIIIIIIYVAQQSNSGLDRLNFHVSRSHTQIRSHTQTHTSGSTPLHQRSACCTTHNIRACSEIQTRDSDNREAPDRRLTQHSTAIGIGIITITITIIITTTHVHKPHTITWQHKPTVCAYSSQLDTNTYSIQYYYLNSLRVQIFKYTAGILSDNNQVPLPVGSFIVLP